MKLLYIYKYFTHGGVESVLYNRYIGMKRLNPSIEIGAVFLNKYVDSDVKLADNIFFTSNLKEIETIAKNYDILSIIDTPEVFGIDFKVPVVLEVHTSYEKERRYIRNTLPGYIKLVITPSKGFMEQVKNEISNKELEIVYVYNPVHDDFYSKEIKTNKIKLDDFRPILWIGRLDSLKNWKEAAKIINGVIKKNPSSDLEFFCVGRTFNIDETVSSLKENGILRYTRYMPDVQFNIMPEIYKKTLFKKGVYLSTSLGESFGMTVAESMACGLPCVMRDLRTLREITENNALYFDSVDEAIQQLSYLLNNEEIFLSMSERLQQTAKKFSIDATVTKYLEYLSQLI